MGITAILADWAAGWPAAPAHSVARCRALDALRDTLGCMVAGAGDVAAQKARAMVGRWSSGGDATVVGSSSGSAAPFAAFANAVAAHAMDYDDTVAHALTHPSAVMIPALLALAEQEDRPCDAVLTAWIVGLEVQVAIGQAVNRDHYDSGWHATSTIGLIGAAAACARLLALDSDRMATALSLATSMTGGSKGQFGTMAKPVHAGLAAQSAVLSAVMARDGFTASAEPLEGPYGFLRLHCREGWRSFEPILSRLGRPPAVEWLGLDTKPYPCCSSIHPGLDGFAELQGEHGFAAEDVAEATATIGRGPALALIEHAPADEMEARFSLSYAVAALLAGRGLRLSDFTETGVARPAVSALASRIAMRVWPAAEEPAGHPVPCEVAIALKDGRRLRKRVDQVRGSLAKPMSDADRAGKFADCAQGLMPEARFSRLVALLAEGDGPLPVRDLMAQLVFEAKVDRGRRFLSRPHGSAPAPLAEVAG